MRPSAFLAPLGSDSTDCNFNLRPCDLILKHMAVCFTPSFILIPSGETIAPKQIGLLIAYFIVSYAVSLFRHYHSS